MFYLSRTGWPSVSVLQIEPSIVSSFLEMVVKLNEMAFRPLFRKLADWAFTGQGGWSRFTPSSRCRTLNPRPLAGPVRGVTFCHVYAALLEYFKVTTLCTCIDAELIDVMYRPSWCRICRLSGAPFSSS